MEKLAPNSKFVGNSTEIIQQSKIKASLIYEGLNKINLRDLNPQLPHDSRHWKNMNVGFDVQNPFLDHSSHFSCSSTHP